MPSTYVRRLGARSYMNYTRKTLQEALDSIRKKQLSIRKAASKYQIPKNTLVNHLKGKNPLKTGGQCVFTDLEEKCLVEHIILLSSYGFPITQFDLRCIVGSYLSKLGRNVKKFRNNAPGKEWVRLFLKRHYRDLSTRTGRNISNKRAAVTNETVLEYFDKLKVETLGVPATNIWNYDETSLVDDPGSKKYIVKRGAKYPEKICNTTKAATTLMCCGNAAGDFAPLFVNYKAEAMWEEWTDGGPSGTRYNRTKSGWLDSRTFEDWFQHLMLPILKRLPGKKILIGDNLSTHINYKVISLCEANNIRFVCLPPNSTHLTQPLDVGVFRSMKGAWRKVLGNWKESDYGRRCGTIPKQNFPRLIKALLNEMSPTLKNNLVASFRACGIYPHDPEHVTKRLIHHQPPSETSSSPSLVSESCIQHLESRRKEVIGQPRSNRRTKMNVPPGVGVTTDDITPENDGDSSHSGKQKPDKKPSQSKPCTQSNSRTQSKFLTLSKSRTQSKSAASGKRKQDSPDSSETEVCESDISYAETEDSQTLDFVNVDSGDDELNLEVDEGSRIQQELPSNQHQQEASILLNDDIQQQERTALDPSSLNQIGDFVLVSYGVKNYPGKITDIDGDEYEISTMVKTGKFWIWPEKEDKIWYEAHKIVKKIRTPRQLNSTDAKFIVDGLKL